MKLRLQCLTRHHGSLLLWNFHAHLLFCDWKMNSVCLQFSCSVVANSLQPHGRQHARLPCPSPVYVLSVYKEIVNIQKHLWVEGRNGHVPGLPTGAPWVWCLPQKPAISGLTQPSLASGHSGSFLQAFPPTPLILPSQNRVVLLITIHCPLQSASPRMSVHQNVSKHHRKRFHHQVTSEEVVYGEAEHDGAPPWRFTKILGL